MSLSEEPLPPEVDESPDEPSPRMKRWAIMIAVAFSAAFLGTWIVFHSIPFQSTLREALRRAETIELFILEDNVPTRLARLSEDADREALAGRLAYQERFWQFSGPPTKAIVISAIERDKTTVAFETRDDGAIHIRKAVRWYRMPVDLPFIQLTRELIATRGADIPADKRPKPDPRLLEEDLAPGRGGS